jgi:hypothetical protein
MRDMDKARFVDEDYESAARAIRTEVVAEFAEQLASASSRWQRFRIWMAINAEVARRLENQAPVLTPKRLRQVKTTAFATFSVAMLAIGIVEGEPYFVGMGATALLLLALYLRFLRRPA